MVFLMYSVISNFHGILKLSNFENNFFFKYLKTDLKERRRKRTLCEIITYDLIPVGRKSDDCRDGSHSNRRHWIGWNRCPVHRTYYHRSDLDLNLPVHD